MINVMNIEGRSPPTFFDTNVCRSIGSQDLNTGAGNAVGNDLVANLNSFNFEIVTRLERSHGQWIRGIEAVGVGKAIGRRALWIVFRSWNTHGEATESCGKY